MLRGIVQVKFLLGWNCCNKHNLVKIIKITTQIKFSNLENPIFHAGEGVSRGVFSVGDIFWEGVFSAEVFPEVFSRSNFPEGDFFERRGGDGFTPRTVKTIIDEAYKKIKTLSLGSYELLVVFWSINFCNKKGTY